MTDIEMKAWTPYSIESNEHTYGYTILLPVYDSQQNNRAVKYMGWKLFTNDGGRVIDSKFGYHVISKQDDTEDEVFIDEYNRRKELSERWIEDYILKTMIRDCFEKDFRGIPS